MHKNTQECVRRRARGQQYSKDQGVVSLSSEELRNLDLFLEDVMLGAALIAKDGALFPNEGDNGRFRWHRQWKPPRFGTSQTEHVDTQLHWVQERGSAL